MRLYRYLGILILSWPAAASQVSDLEAFLGERWYGLYMNGEKVGWAVDSVERKDDTVVVKQDMQFQIRMTGIRNDMQVSSERVYGADDRLIALEQTVVDPANTSTFHARAEGEEFVVISTVASEGGKEQRVPRPQETLSDALKYQLWVRSQPQAGASITLKTFEPMLNQELNSHSEVAAIEEHMFEGAMTKVYKIKSVIQEMNVTTVSFVTESGALLEDQVAGMLTMRLEPEAVAKDVNYSNDTIVSNAAIVKTPIEDPRTREELRLKLTGPLTGDHLFNDNRQFLEAADGYFSFRARRVNLEGFTTAQLPITDPQLTPWLEPTVFIQSDNPRLLAKAREIAGDEKDTWTIAQKLCHWVSENVHSTYSARLTNALEVLDSLEGDCTEHSILFIGLCRAIGLPAREVAGLIYVRDDPPGFYFHQWAKVWIGQWVDVDPTFNQPLADVTHIKLAEGDLLAQSRIMPLIGHVKIEVVEEDAAPSPAFEDGNAAAATAPIAPEAPAVEPAAAPAAG